MVAEAEARGKSTMLVIGRREGERIRIGQDVWVCVTEVRGGKIRLGIEAPPDVLVLREELLPEEEPDGREGEGTGRNRAA